MSRKIKRKYISKKTRDRVMQKYDGACAYCGSTNERLELDHLNPISSYHGTEEESNYMPACRPCNRFKSSFTLEQFRNELLMQKDRAFKYSINARMAKRYGFIKETTMNEVIFYFEKRSE